MTPRELRATLDCLDLSAAEAGHLLGVHRATEAIRVARSSRGVMADSYHVLRATLDRLDLSAAEAGHLLGVQELRSTAGSTAPCRCRSWSSCCCV